MKPRSVKIELSKRSAAYDIVIGHDMLAECGNWARKSLGKRAGKVVVVSNPTVFELYGKQVLLSLEVAGFAPAMFLIGDGERYKSLRSAESAINLFSETGLSRTDAVIALGGGVVGDLAGFASAIYLRGIPFLQIPTTLLSMIDSSVGGKTGVNSRHGKNLIGAFHQPSGVLIDTATLMSLPHRELAAGFYEAVKQGAIGGRKLLLQTGDFVESFPLIDLSKYWTDKTFQTRVADLIGAQVAFKASIVAGDEFESSDRRDGSSRKILNFGHTLAHALEKVTRYKKLKHGEAVGFGILFAAELSKSLALCGEKDVKLLNDVVHRVGTLPRLAAIDIHEVFEAFKFDKKNLTGSLQMVLLKGIGKPVMVDEKNIPRSSARTVLKKLLQIWA